MYHIGIDMHKRFSRVEVINGSGEVEDRRILPHDDRAGMRHRPSPVGIRTVG
jgi:hypothetical protein